MLNGSGYASSFLDHLGVLGNVNLKSLTRRGVEKCCKLDKQSKLRGVDKTQLEAYT